MVDWGDQDPIRPDYSKNVLGIYAETMGVIYRERLPKERFSWQWYNNKARDVLSSLELWCSSPQELGATYAVIGDVMELRHPPWSGEAYTHRMADKSFVELCTYFSYGRWVSW